MVQVLQEPKMVSSVVILLLFFVFGILSHLLFFSRGERHLYPLRYIAGVSYLFTSLAVVFYRTCCPSIWTAYLAASTTTALYLIGLYSSLIAYRLFFHPARHIPGPLLARVSDMALSVKLQNLDSGDQIAELHKRYGKVVRIGSNSVSVISPAGPQAIYGFESKCTKSPWYDLATPLLSLVTMRNREVHARRRRVWSPAFSDRALRGYEQRLKPYVCSFLGKLHSTNSQPLDITELTSHYAWDVTSDLAFGDSFKMLESSPNSGLVEKQKAANIPLGWLLPVWFFRLLITLPGMAKEWDVWNQFIATQTDKRMKNKPEIPDMFESFIKPLQGREPSKAELDLLRGDANLVLGAGSDTSATTLAYAFRSLATHPQQIELIRAEIINSVPASSHFNLTNLDLQYLPHLNAVIQETLRVYPAIPAHNFRETPAGGIQIDDSTFIPGGIDVMCPQWVINRSEEIYEHPESWIPERWTTRPEMNHTVAGCFFPFGAGPTGCIGKPLAMMSMRLLIANAVMHYDIQLPNDRMEEVIGKCMHTFTLKPPVFNLVFVPRTERATV